MLGVEIIFNVSFENLMPPVVDANDETEENIKGRILFLKFWMLMND